MLVENGEFRTPDAWLNDYVDSIPDGKKILVGPHRGLMWKVRYQLALSLAERDPHVLPYEPGLAYMDRMASIGIMSVQAAKDELYRVQHDMRNKEILARDNNGNDARAKLCKKLKGEGQRLGGL